MKQFNNIFKGKRVLITGHTGFKGSWMSLWMESLGAKVGGFSLSPETNPNHFELLNLNLDHTIGDIRNSESIASKIDAFRPEVIFHLAAQPIVSYGYSNPVETYETNVMGTINLLEACRNKDYIKAIVCVTTDKVYENMELSSGYVESDKLGGYDPYSSSKACSEILISSYVHSFFNPNRFGIDHNTLIASVRGGNVVGGGDWSKDRLIPDIYRAQTDKSQLHIRNPKSYRPWQHVLDCLSGYILLGQKLLEGNVQCTGPWNFGPKNEEIIDVKRIVEIAQTFWKDLSVKLDEPQFHETKILSLQIKKAQEKLLWNPTWNSSKGIQKTFEWYDGFIQENEIISLTQLKDYLQDSINQNANWISNES